MHVLQQNAMLTEMSDNLNVDIMNLINKTNHMGTCSSGQDTQRA